MKTEFTRFGQVDKFEIALRWTADIEPPARRPSGHGWSMGDLELTVAGVNLTASQFKKDRQSHVGWYLAPMFAWLAENWISLLHEQDFSWPNKDAAPAAIACRRALDSWIGATDDDGRKIYREVQSWYREHGLRSAAAGGIFPDLFIRRFADDIELSWSGALPPFAPDGLIFESGAGVARLAVADVAGPLWQLLQWMKRNPPSMDELSQAHWEALCRRVDAIELLDVQDFESVVVTEELLSRVRKSFARINKSELLNDYFDDSCHFVEAFSPAIAMFGGVSPQIGDRDVDALRDVLVLGEGGRDSQSLAALVDDRRHLPIGGVPHDDGYEFAEEFLLDLREKFGNILVDGFVDVHEICNNLGIDVNERQLDTCSIRGVALAGEGFRSMIVLNSTSVFNKSVEGKRFTVAHELCHILFDRTRARRVAHTSGPWAPVGIEKRANAFAAYLLMPRQLIRQYLASSGGFDPVSIQDLADRLRVNETALVEHLYNLAFIDEVQREELRAFFRSQALPR